MQTTSLDILEQSELPAGPARAILRVMELEISARGEALATKADMKEAFHALQLEIQALRGEFRAEIQAVRAEIRESESKMTRWVLTCTMGQAAMIAAAVYFALTHLRP